MHRRTYLLDRDAGSSMLKGWNSSEGPGISTPGPGAGRQQASRWRSAADDVTVTALSWHVCPVPHVALLLEYRWCNPWRPSGPLRDSDLVARCYSSMKLIFALTRYRTILLFSTLA